MSDMDCCCFMCVKEKDIAMIENLGQYNRTAESGILIKKLIQQPLATLSRRINMTRILLVYPLLCRVPLSSVPNGKHCWHIVTQDSAAQCAVRYQGTNQ